MLSTQIEHFEISDEAKQCLGELWTVVPLPNFQHRFLYGTANLFLAALDIVPHE